MLSGTFRCRTLKTRSSARRFTVQFDRATGGVEPPWPAAGVRRRCYRRVWYGEAEQPFDPKRMAYDEYVGSVVGPITVKDVMEAAGASDKTAKGWLDSDPRLMVTAYGGRGSAGPRTWQRNGSDPFGY